MNRKDFQRPSAVRLREAQVLLQNRLYSGAYYLAGYAVECALKACIAKRTRRSEFPDRAVVNRSYSHDPKQLADAAKLNDQLLLETGRDELFKSNWGTVVTWSEESRYKNVARERAFELVEAISDEQHGVLQWLRRFW